MFNPIDEYLNYAKTYNTNLFDVKNKGKFLIKFMNY
jgi:hypothetical protein